MISTAYNFPRWVPFFNTHLLLIFIRNTTNSVTTHWWNILKPAVRYILCDMRCIASRRRNAEGRCDRPSCSFAACNGKAVKPRESHAILRSEPYVTPRFCAFTWQCNGGCARSDCSSLNSYFKSFSIPILGRIQSDESSWEQKGPKRHARSELY